MNSARPCNTTTVPLRPGGGAQRAKRKLTPSGVLIAPVTTWSGTGLAGMETSFMDGHEAAAASWAWLIAGGELVFLCLVFFFFCCVFVFFWFLFVLCFF